MFSKKGYVNIIFLILLFFWARVASAQFEITEIMYDVPGSDAKREWVEVKNTGTTPDDISLWHLLSDNTKHSIIPISLSSMVPADAYLVIVQDPSKFRSDWPSYIGLLFDSSWSGFNNKNETIALVDPNGNISNEVNINSNEGATGDGYSLQKINGAWVSSLPTPGLMNKISPLIKKEPPAPIAESKQKSSSRVGITQLNSSQKDQSITSQLVELKSDSEKVVDLNNITFSADGNTKFGSSNKALPYIGLIGIVAIGSFIVFSMKKKNPQLGIEEQNITADDITIVD